MPAIEGAAAGARAGGVSSRLVRPAPIMRAMSLPMTAERRRFLILSSHTKPTLTGPGNHARYAERHGYRYLFDATPYKIGTPYDQKLSAIIENLVDSSCEWLLWVDEDAYFMNHAIRLEHFLPADGVDFVICRSPTNPDGVWTAINSGVFFVRNTPAAIDIIRQAKNTKNEVVKSWWRPDECGLFIEGGDQERLLYVFKTQGMIGSRVQIKDATEFNARIYQYRKNADEHFICHLASHKDKAIPLKMMREKFGLDEYLMPRPAP